MAVCWVEDGGQKGIVFDGGLKMPVFKPLVFGDERGHFFESYNERDWNDALSKALSCSFSVDFVQDNQSFSHKGVFRGLHYQPGQAKLVRVVSGAVADFMVDIRPGSKTFGQFDFAFLTRQNGYQVFIPDGFAHGFLAVEDTTFFYKVTAYWDKEAEGGIRWDDEDIGINWIIEDDTWHDIDKVVTSERDQQLPSLKTLTPS
jgi:dTDP-4-dehydrorhamnose 3,5-epimerase